MPAARLRTALADVSTPQELSPAQHAPPAADGRVVDSLHGEWLAALTEEEADG